MAPSLADQEGALADANDGGRISKRLVFSYVVDWIFIAFTAALGRIFHSLEPNRHLFSLNDPSISYPYTIEETVPVDVLIVVSLIVPAAVVLVFSLVFTPGLTVERHAPKGLAWRRKLWEWNAGWMGLGVAYAATYAATEGLKVLFGRPRPDLLSRCDPDLSDIRSHRVGVLASAEIVSWTICRNASTKLVRDGFVSFPSGHASSSFAGLTYLSLWLCSKLCVSFPSIWKGRNRPDPRQTAFLVPGGLPSNSNDAFVQDDELRCPSLVPLRNQDAAPPTYLLLIVMIPIATAAYIASSRYVDNRHFGWDILAGSALGVGFAYIGFRLYHLPLSSRAGWAWGPRSRDRAFFAGVGLTGYVGEEGTSSARDKLSSPKNGNTRVMTRTNTSASYIASRPCRVVNGHGES